MNYAGFWKRFGAILIDTIIIIPISFIIGFAIGFALIVAGMDPESLAEPSIQFIFNIIGVIIAWIYYALMECSRMQGTIGKMALGIKVTDLEGNQISFAKATGRHFGKIISSVILGVGYIMVAFTERKQGLHDMMAGCLVVNK